MKPKCAWIDHSADSVLFALELRQRGIQLDVRATLDLFLEDFDLKDYPVLLYHPGINEQHKIKEVMEKYPNLNVALITAPCSSGEYKLPAGTKFFTYNSDSVEKFIRDNQ